MILTGTLCAIGILNKPNDKINEGVAKHVPKITRRRKNNPCKKGLVPVP